ncbi:hypothetical protein Clacol_005844, partial [Clathrus columnatus]
MVNSREDRTEQVTEFKYFRILIIGRANAGKTTLLKHISNAGNNSEHAVYHKYRWRPSIKPTDGRGIHDINQSFYFPSNPRFVFHDSPGFETGDETQLKQVQEFIHKRSKTRRLDKQLHAIWFCLVTNASRPLLELETRFFNEERPDNVPVIAIFTKFDDLMSQIYDPELGWQENRQVAEQTLDTKFKRPLLSFKFPPNAYVTMEDMHTDTPSRQSQVMKLMEETANALDNLTLKRLFISIQRTNLELCLTYGATHKNFETSKTILNPNGDNFQAMVPGFNEQETVPGQFSIYFHYDLSLVPSYGVPNPCALIVNLDLCKQNTLKLQVSIIRSYKDRMYLMKSFQL